MKILLLSDGIPPHATGGAGRIVWESATHLAKAGHEVTVLSAAPKGTPHATLEGVHLRFISIKPQRFAHYRSVFSSSRAREILKIIREVQPDLIHAHAIAWQCGYKWMEGAARRHIPLVITLHDAMTVAYGKVREGEKEFLWRDMRQEKWNYNPFRNALIARALSFCSMRLCVSDALRTFLELHLPPLVTLHNGIDTEFWTPSSQENARNALHLPNDKTMFLLAGRLGTDKGTDVITKNIPADSLLLVAGRADEKAFASLGSNVRFYPSQSAQQMRLLYAACDIALVPSLYLDPFPTICLEAMSCGRPVMATCFGGAKEAVNDGVTGWILNPRDGNAVRSRLAFCTTHRNDLKQYGTHAREHIEHSFSLEKHLEELASIYSSCVKGKKKL